MKWTQLVPFRRAVSDTRRQAQKSTQNIKAGLSAYRQLFGQGQAGAATQIHSFDDALAAWELRREEIPAAKKALRTEICVWIATACLMLGGATTSSSGWIITQLATVTFVCLFAAMARAWRYWVLDQQYFIPFKYWIIGKKTKNGGGK